MSIYPVAASPAQASTPTTPNSTTGTSETAADYTSMFMQLLSTELQSQDPTQTMDPTTMVTQMVQINQLNDRGRHVFHHAGASATNPSSASSASAIHKTGALSATKPPAHSATSVTCPSTQRHRAQRSGRQLMPNFSIPLSGLDASDTALATISNNLANLNTTGYKDTTVNFQDLFYQLLGSNGSGDQLQVGSGTSIASVGTNFSGGSVQNTGVNTDVAITGNGFFVVQNGSNTYYTRAGAFTQNPLVIWLPPMAIRSWVIRPPMEW